MKLKKKNKTRTLIKLLKIVKELANFEVTTQYKNHKLQNTNPVIWELHVEPNILLTYRYVEDGLIIDLKLYNVVDHDSLNRSIK